MKQAHVEVLKVLPLLEPKDIAATATTCQWLDLDQCVGLVEFEVNFGAITSTDSTGEAAVTVLASTAGGTDAGTAVAFSYALSAAVGTDSMGAVTAATSSGITMVSSSDDNRSVFIYLDPAAAIGSVADARWATVKIDATADVSATLVSVVGRYTPRYSQASQNSST